jgi:hypothetical protein
MFKTTFVFCALSNWITGIVALSTKNYAWATIASFLVSGSAITIEFFSTREVFGTTSLVLIMVFLTILGNTVSGVWKNNMKARLYFAAAQKHPFDTKERRLNMRRWRNHKFEFKKIMFVFFKGFVFLSYLMMVKALTSDSVGGSGEWEIQALYITTESLIRIPIALFWYYEFKSIGENSEYITGKKKVKIFTIVGWVFEPGILRFKSGESHAESIHDNNDFDTRYNKNNRR